MIDNIAQKFMSIFLSTEIEVFGDRFQALANVDWFYHWLISTKGGHDVLYHQTNHAKVEFTCKKLKQLIDDKDRRHRAKYIYQNVLLSPK